MEHEEHHVVVEEPVQPVTEAVAEPTVAVVHDPFNQVHDRLGHLETFAREAPDRYAPREHEHPQYARHEDVQAVAASVPDHAQQAVDRSLDTVEEAPPAVEEIVLNEPEQPEPEPEPQFGRKRIHGRVRRVRIG